MNDPEKRLSLGELARRASGGKWYCPKCNGDLIEGTGDKRHCGVCGSPAPPADPWACPSCGRDMRGEQNSAVESTRYDAEGVRRRRICRHCRQSEIKTKEVPVPNGFKVLVVHDDETRACA